MATTMHQKAVACKTDENTVVCLRRRGTAEAVDYVVLQGRMTFRQCLASDAVRDMRAIHDADIGPAGDCYLSVM